VAQQLIAPGERRSFTVPLEQGRYRLRALELEGAAWLRASQNGGTDRVEFTLNSSGWPTDEISIELKTQFEIENETGAEQLLILERTAWFDDAVTAAEVTALQVFRDLFSTEALRRGERISVGGLTVLFTDLRGSTQLYREIGDAPAFGRVMNHFDVLRQCISDEDGALVKTIGDAVMAVFRSPGNALRAMLKAQKILRMPENGAGALQLKGGIHSGPSIAVNLNDRLDYFGGTINMASRLESLSTGSDVVISSEVFGDPEVRAMLSDPDSMLKAEAFESPLKGFDNQTFTLWRVKEITQTQSVVSSEQRKNEALL
jgi:adenylate cyclase